MNNTKIIIPIIIGVIIIAGVIITMNQEQGSTELEDILNKEIEPTEEELIPEIQNKIDDIEQTNEENQYSPKPREWITSGPFQIDRSEYILGEKIFLRIGGLDYEEKGQVAFMRPLNSSHYSVFITVPFDGATKGGFNYYVEPQLSKTRGYCTVDDFVGEWQVKFRGTDYPNIKFTIIEDILPGNEDSFKPVC